MVVDLPQEIIDGIIDHLAADAAALDACSLTSRSFLPRSRLHRWKWINFNKPFTIEESFAMYVRELLAFGIELLPWEEIEKCVNLKRLSLSHDSLQQFPSRFDPSRFHPLTSVEDLYVHRCDFTHQNSPTIPQFLSYFPNLSSLSVFAPNVDVTASIAKADSAQEFTLPQLSGDLCTDTDYIIRVLLLHPRNVRFRSIQIIAGDHYFGNINRLFVTCGPSLEVIDIENVIRASLDDIASLDLSANENLRHLKLACFHTRNGWSHAWDLQMLSNTPSSHIIRIDISCAYKPSGRRVLPFDWHAFDQLLSGSRFSMLKRLKISCDGCEDWHEQLPRLSALGKLKVSH